MGQLNVLNQEHEGEKLLYFSTFNVLKYHIYRTRALCHTNGEGGGGVMVVVCVCWGREVMGGTYCLETQVFVRKCYIPMARWSGW